MTKKLLSIVITLFVPIFIIAGSLWFGAQPWLIHYEYSRINIPSDAPDLETKERISLAQVGLRSIVPGSEGIELLKKTTLLSGKQAFNEREISHMADVRNLLTSTYFLAIFGVLLIALLALIELGNYGPLLQGLKNGALVTLISIGALIIASLLNFDWFFLQLHNLFFKDESFLFDPDDMLIRLYPEEFWEHAVLLIGALSLTMAFLLLGISYVGLRVYGKSQKDF